MSEFGHLGSAVGSLRVDAWGAGPFVLRTPDGREHRFEDSDRLDSVRLRKDDEISDARPWGERHPFWVEHDAWRRQGRRTAPDGITCIVDPEP